MVTILRTPLGTTINPRGAPTGIEITSVSRRFGERTALDGVSLRAGIGEIHALLGPNGAGKTTLLRSLSGLVDPDDGEIRIAGERLEDIPRRRAHQLVGLVPSGDRSFYQRISGLENLVFFGRLHGLRRAQAVERSRDCLDRVGLTRAARVPVGRYSHGMQKRLSVARALLMEPFVLLVDEASHDLDPEGARTVRDLVAERAGQGSVVIWATQRIDEIRGFAQRITLLDHGEVRFSGTVPQFMAIASSQRHLMQLRTSEPIASELLSRARGILGPAASIGPSDDLTGGHFVVSLRDGVTLGEIVSSLTAGGIEVLSCREERSGIEEAFLSLTVREDR
jgi:ABC-type multidrug transport system ATPase subunit